MFCSLDSVALSGSEESCLRTSIELVMRLQNCLWRREDRVPISFAGLLASLEGLAGEFPGTAFCSCRLE